MSTGPAEPLAGDQIHWEEDVPAPVPGLVDEKGAGQPLELEMNEPRPVAARLRLRHLMYLIAAVAVLCWLVIATFGLGGIGPFLFVVSIVFAFAAVLGGTIIVARGRVSRQDALLSVLAIAAERGVPLAPAILAFADQYRGISYGRIMNLAARINWGIPLPEALKQSGNLVSRDAILLTWAGEASGTMPRALRMAAAARLNQLPIWTAISARLSYILGLLLIMQSLIGFMMYFIVPKFEAIFKDFGVSLPQITIVVVEASHWVVRYGFVTLWIPLVELALLIFIPLSFLFWSNYKIPLFDRLLARRHMALVLRSLALFVEGGKPVSLGLATVARHYPTLWVRRRLLTVEKEIDQGADWIESLTYHRVIRRTDADVLRSAAAVGNLEWALLEVAETAERRLAVRFQMVVQTLFPVVIVMLGMLVFVMAMAYFVPLVSLISELTRV